MNYVVTPFQLGLGIFGVVCFFVLAIIMVFFFRLIRHQLKIWALAKRGYKQIRHIREDMVENNYFLKVDGNHYAFDQGVYMDQKDVKTKAFGVLAKIDPDLLGKNPDKVVRAEERQIKKFLDSIENSKVMDINTLSWGIPTITYFGDDPQPVNYRERKKFYDAKNISAMIKRILLTKEWKLVRMALIVGMVGIGLALLIGFLNYGVMQNNSKNLGACINMLNDTTVKYNVLLNQTQQEHFNMVLNNISNVINI